MRFRIVVMLAVLLAPCLVTAAAAQDSGKKRSDAAFALGDVPYFHRFTTGDQYEYTPAGQDDLKAWNDMATIHYYRQVKDGDALAGAANAVLQNYQAAKGIVVKTDSVARIADKPAEHLVVVILGRPEFMEVAFARFRMHNDAGSAIIYSHRIYGKNSGDEMGAWLQKNGAATEKTLMTWNAMPKLPAPK
jgi:hypothetical protein